MGVGELRNSHSVFSWSSVMMGSLKKRFSLFYIVLPVETPVPHATRLYQNSEKKKNEKEDMVRKGKSNKCVLNTNDAARPFIIPSVLNTTKASPFLPCPPSPLFPETIYRTLAKTKTTTNCRRPVAYNTM